MKKGIGKNVMPDLQSRCGGLPRLKLQERWLKAPTMASLEPLSRFAMSRPQSRRRTAPCLQRTKPIECASRPFLR